MDAMLRSVTSRVNLEGTMIEQLRSLRFIPITGKGGVGKSTIAAAMALESASKGARTLLCEVGGEERLGPMLVGSPMGSVVTSLLPNLWGVSIRQREALLEYGKLTLKFEALSRAVFNNPLARQFLRFVPSIQELVLLGKVLFHVRDDARRFDRVILDAPATGHAVGFFSVPKVLLETVRGDAMAKEAAWMHALLVDERVTGAVIVALPEETPVNEALELADQLQSSVQIRPRAFVLNRFHAPKFSAEEVEGVAEPLKGLLRSLRLRAERSARSAIRLQATGIPVHCIEELEVDHLDSRSLAAIGSALGTKVAPR